MKKYLRPETVTSLIGLLMFVLKNDIVEFTNIEAKIILIIIGMFLAFGYTVENLKYMVDKLKMFMTKKEKPPSVDVEDEEEDEIEVIEITIPKGDDD